MHKYTGLFTPAPKSRKIALKHWRYPWDTDMSICIAAIADRPKDTKIIFCADARIEVSDFASAETGFKMAWVSDSWLALMAGNLGRARDAVASYTDSPPSTKSESKALEDIEQCNGRLKKNKIEHLLMARVGMSFAEFVDKGKTSIPDDIFASLWREIESMRLECELVLIGFTDTGTPMLFSYDDQNGVQLCDHFACIGSGAWIAKAALYQRGCTDRMGVEEVLYYVYEAKRLSEIAPGVGKTTHIGLTAYSTESIVEHLVPLGRDKTILKNLAGSYRRFAFRKFKKSRGLSLAIGQATPTYPQLTTADPSPLPPLPELPEGSDES